MKRTYPIKSFSGISQLSILIWYITFDAIFDIYYGPNLMTIQYCLVRVCFTRPLHFLLTYLKLIVIWRRKEIKIDNWLSPFLYCVVDSISMSTTLKKVRFRQRILGICIRYKISNIIIDFMNFHSISSYMSFWTRLPDIFYVQSLLPSTLGSVLFIQGSQE